MPVDTRQKRMAAMNLASPWRGPLVDATEVGFNAGNRAAADLLYSGITAGPPATTRSRGVIRIDHPSGFGTDDLPPGLGDWGS